MPTGIEKATETLVKMPASHPITADDLRGLTLTISISVLLVVAGILWVVMLKNFKLQYKDPLEKALTSVTDIPKTIKDTLESSIIAVRQEINLDVTTKMTDLKSQLMLYVHEKVSGAKAELEKEFLSQIQHRFDAMEEKIKTRDEKQSAQFQTILNRISEVTDTIQMFDKNGTRYSLGIEKKVDQLSNLRDEDIKRVRELERDVRNIGKSKTDSSD